ncbi:MAG: imidazole glycerol phosphate synthase subunit HisH [Deltaproteobacteria bacterium]|nr:imidazole glycerol phosphate synthase subunit HisH [Deltaproteobacteria bacterium]
MFSVKHACERVGLEATITSSIPEIIQADAVILPGVGAFGDAMEQLKALDLISPLKDLVGSSKPFIGICLGYQLLLSESEEFGSHKGLGIVKGAVKRFDQPREGDHILSVPHVGWNQIWKDTTTSWEGSPLRGTTPGDYVYFCHSYYVQPEDQSVALTRTHYGHYDFISSLRCQNVFGFQFHPEKSGPVGLEMYQNIAKLIGA